MLEDQMAKAMAEASKDIAEDIVRPTSKSIGNNLGLLVDGVMGWLGYWGQKQAFKREIYLEDYKKKINEKVSAVPEEKLQEPEIRIVGPAIEASKYYIEEEEFRKLFAELIASTCHTDVAKKVHPSFPEMIKQLTLLDIKILESLKKAQTFPCSDIYIQHQNNNVSSFYVLLFDFKKCEVHFSQEEELSLIEVIDNLTRLGLLVKNSNILELNYDYNQFKEHWLYKSISQTLPPEDKLNIKKYRIELTQLGRNFVKCCFGE